MLGEQPVARLARGVLDAGCRLVAAPRQSRVLEAQRSGLLRDPIGFIARVGAQTMIDGRHLQRHVRRVALLPARGKVHQRDAVGAAGHGKDG